MIGSWGQAFAGDPVLLDRAAPSLTVVAIRGESYRLKDKRRAGMLKRFKLQWALIS